MAQILGIIIMLYSLAVFPLVVAGLIRCYVKGSRTSMEYVVLGWTGALSVFAVEAIAVISSQGSLSNLKNLWLATMLVISVGSFWKNWALARGMTIKKVRTVLQGKWRIIAGMIVVTACTLLFVMPDLEDDTTEIVLESYVTDTMYKYQPYSEEEYKQIPAENHFSPIEMYYAVMARLSEFHPATVVKLVIPVFFLPIVVCVYLLWAKKIFPYDPKAQRLFLMLAGIVFLFAVFSERMKGISVLQNCWKGEILLGTVMLPLVCYYCLEIMENIYEQGIKKQLIAQYGIILTITSITSQLMYRNGFVFSGIVLATGIAIAEVRRHFICSR